MASRSRKGRMQVQGLGEVLDAFLEDELARRPEVRIINKYAVIMAYIRIGLKGIGALALLWATVVLLGGFVSTLNKKDFLSLTLIAFVQAAGLSDAVGDDRFAFFGEWFSSLQRNTTSWGEKLHHKLARLSMRQRLGKKIRTIVSEMINFTLNLIFFPVAIFVVAGPALCVAVSVSRVLEQDYGVADGDTSKANLKPALNLFYYVSLSHGAIYLLTMLVEVVADPWCVAIVSQRGFSPEILDEYLQQTKEMCVKNPASTKSWNLITYGAGLLDSQLPEEYVCGGKVLTMLIDQDIPVPITRLLIRSPRQRIQKLIGTLGWGDPEEREMRWLAARIVEHIAGHLNLAQFPGALECVSTLLDASCHNNSGDQEALHLPLEIWRNKAAKRTNFLAQIQTPAVHLEGEDGISIRIGGLSYIREWIHEKYGTGQDSKHTTENDLVLPGLRILDKLAHNVHNCTLIYNAEILLSKLVAPISSDTLIQDAEGSAAWTKVVDGSLKVVSRLMVSPGKTGQDMRGEISDNRNAVKNLVAVLHMDVKSNSSVIELQIGAIEALTQLALHQPADSERDYRSRQYFIERVLHIFLTNDWMEDHLKDVQMKIDDETNSQQKRQSRTSTVRCMDNLSKRACGERARQKMKAQAAEAQENRAMKQAEETASRLKEKAGEALSMLLSMATQGNSEVHKTIILRRKGIVNSLIELLDSNIMTITCVISTTKTLEIERGMGCRINAAVILKHLIDHLEELSQPKLRKVLVKLLTTQAHPSDDTRTLKWWDRPISTYCTAESKSDQENPCDGGQHPSTLHLKVSHKQKSEEIRLKAELLSLVVAIGTSKNLSFASVLSQPQQFAPKEFVVGFKQMVDDNCRYATPACLAILKLICEMVIELIPHDGIFQVIHNHDMVGTLLKASKRMDELESSMLFAGVDRDCYGVPLKPLSSVLAKRAKDLLSQRQQEPDITACACPANHDRCVYSSLA